MVNAIISAPNTTKGLRSSSRRPMFTPVCTWLMSVVNRVIMVSAPRVSSSVKENFWMWSNTAWRKSAAKPVLALAAKNWAVMLHAKPSSAMAISSRKHCTSTPRFCPATPTLIIRATTRGTSKSNTTSSSLNSGARMLCAVYRFR